MNIVMVLIFVNIMINNTSAIWLKVLGFIVIVSLNNTYTLVLFFMILKTKIMALYGKKVRPVLRWFKKNTPIWMCFCCTVDDEKSMKVYMNWGKVRKAIRKHKG